MLKSMVLFVGHIGAMFCGIGLYSAFEAMSCRSPYVGIVAPAPGVSVFWVPLLMNWVTTNCASKKTPTPWMTLLNVDYQLSALE